MKPIRFLADKTIVQASQDESILEACLRAGVDVDHSCGGFGSCGTCRIFVVGGLEKLSPRNEVEQEIATDRGFATGERLACQTLAVDGVQVLRPGFKEES